MHSDVYNKVVKALANTISKDNARNLYVAGITRHYGSDGKPYMEYAVDVRDANDPEYLMGKEERHSVSWDPGAPNILQFNG